MAEYKERTIILKGVRKMNEIKCPKCNEVFKIDETGFADIVKQVRDKEFEKALSEREVLVETEKKLAVT